MESEVKIEGGVGAMEPSSSSSSVKLKNNELHKHCESTNNLKHESNDLSNDVKNRLSLKNGLVVNGLNHSNDEAVSSKSSPVVLVHDDDQGKSPCPTSQNVLVVDSVSSGSGVICDSVPCSAESSGYSSSHEESRQTKNVNKNQIDKNGTTDEKQPPDYDITYVSYESELQMPDIMRLIQKDLSEPYSIYTYRYFIHNWPKLCFLAMFGDECVGAIVCKLDMHRKTIKRGYIAMLAVDEKHRKKRIGSNLVLKAIRAMVADGADEVVLETEITNKPALRLYENLGFVRDKRLFRYYLNGVDALRLKLWLR